MSIDSSPIESALESYLNAEVEQDQGPLITKFHKQSAFIPFQVSYALPNLSILDYQSFSSRLEVYVVSCEDTIFLVSVLETISKEKISSVRKIEGVEGQGQGMDYYLGMNIYINSEASPIIQILTKNGIHNFKQ